MKEKILKKLVNRETMLYTIFGVLTSLQNIAMFAILLKLGMAYKVANIITLITVKLTAYLCNKNFVFKSHCANLWELTKEFARFVFWRGATMLLDYFGLIFLVEIVKMPELIGKVIMTVFVIAVNYVTGKRHVFKNKEVQE
ncbi:Putative flippase GtrA (transmembrane translocase of bactoprenol-linked glucose) [Pseudobutyrivibrio sp. YE44]|uniref:GtrA family protein n=1 Tax=Pseudobutyrivibrio sp. YE44 TaxID=1520802 RepID=UPI000884C1A5|nr:GtrA family protein [Pseudobutyrivibrio sp. YE44]SDB53386.1 Putative flippase GtrA (transmembrane translocase of bactoprenol-linked glucose) [Pseudobutyrivibrio sp. YE44]